MSAQNKNHKLEDTILKVWKHRKSLPHDSYPLRKYESVLKVLNWFLHAKRILSSLGFEIGVCNDGLGDLFENLSRLIINVLLMDIPESIRLRPVDAAVIAALTEDEKRILEEFSRWSALFCK